MSFDHEDRRRSSDGAAAGGGSSADSAVGKRTLTADLPASPAYVGAVQRVAESAAPDADTVHAAAREGISGPSAALPHLDRIQQLFGRHDVSSVQAHVGGPAEAASRQMGALAYATGDHVAFGASPDLHTASHEAAHVVQQRAGVHLKKGVGAAGDSYEHHADAVADKVVRGESAEGLLDQMSGGGAPQVGRAPAQVSAGTAVQRATAPDPAYEKAQVAGPNKNKTINWDDPPALYGIEGGSKTSLRGLYQQHLREHLSKEPLMAELGYQALLPSEIGARIEAIADETKPLWVGSIEKKGPAAAKPYREALWRCSQRAIVDTLSSTTSDERYKKDKVPMMKDGKPVLDENGQPILIDQTYCNVYGPDMVNAMGGYLPRVWYVEDLKSPTKLPAAKLQELPKAELSANLIGAWLTKWGRDFGWKPTADAKAAQAAANTGRVVIIQASKADGVSAGHVNVVLAEGAGHNHTTDAQGGFQPLQSQAGEGNFKYSDTATEGQGIGDNWWAVSAMKKEPDGNFWIYQGAAQGTAVAGATEMGGKFD